MKTYYGQMTKEELDKKYFVPSSIEEMNAFIDMCKRAGYIGILETSIRQIGVNYSGDNRLQWMPISDSCFYSNNGMTKINWKPHPEEEPKDLKAQLARAIANRDKRYKKARKATEKLKESEQEVERIIKEIEQEVESIGNLSCHIKEIDYNEGIPEGVDVDDPSTWQDGDIVECVEITYNPDEKWFTVGKQYEYKSCGGIPYIAEDNEGDWSCIEEAAKFRFVSRP